MGAAMESEAKWQVDRAFVLPDLGTVRGLAVQPGPETLLSAAYYDTHDMSLLRLGATLRRRTGDGVERWTLKLPATPSARLLHRHEVDFAGGGARPPLAARHALRAVLGGQRLHRVCEVQTRRRVYRLVDDQGGVPVAELCDDRVRARGRHLAVRSFREIELEVTPEAPRGLVRRVGRLLERAGARTEGSYPKLRRAVWGSATAPSTTGPHAEHVSNIVALALGSAVDRLLAHDPAIRLDLDPEAVHQTRVAVRQLRSQLRTFRDYLEPAWTRSTRSALDGLGLLLGAVRDMDVLSAWLDDPPSTLPAGDLPSLHRLREAASGERQAAFARLSRALRGDRYGRLIADLRRAASFPPMVGAEADELAAEALPGILRRPLGHLRRAVKALPASPGREHLHHVRILAKRARYASEAAVPLLGRRAERLAASLANLQTELGEVQDATNAEAWLRRAALVDPAMALVGGELLAVRRAAVAQTLERWPKAWRRVRREIRRAGLEALSG